MAQEFVNYYRTFMKEQYSNSENQPLLALKNHTKQFAKARPLATGGVKYFIEIPKRIKPKEVTLGNTTASALALLDSGSTIAWETKDVVVTTPHSVGFRTFKGDNLFMGENAQLHKNWLRASINVVTKMRMEQIIAEMVKGKTASAASLTDPWTNIAQDIVEVTNTVDDYVYDIPNERVFVWVNDLYAINLAKQKGSYFRNEVPVFGTGFTAKQSINGSPIFINKQLATTKVGNKHIAYIVFALDAFYFDYMNPRGFSTIIADTNFVGAYFFDLMLNVFSNRIKVRTFSGKDKAKVKA